MRDLARAISITRDNMAESRYARASISCPGLRLRPTRRPSSSRTAARSGKSTSPRRRRHPFPSPPRSTSRWARWSSSRIRSTTLVLTVRQIREALTFASMARRSRSPRSSRSALAHRSRMRRPAGHAACHRASRSANTPRAGRPTGNIWHLSRGPKTVAMSGAFATKRRESQSRKTLPPHGVLRRSGV